MLIGKFEIMVGFVLWIEVIGYGVVYFLSVMFDVKNDLLCGKCCLVLGVGNVVFYLMEKLV